MVRTAGSGCLFAPVMLVVVVVGGSISQSNHQSGKDAEKTTTTTSKVVNIQWLSRPSTVSQYGRHWDRFRDEVEDYYFRTVGDSQGSKEVEDSTKDPCQKVKCTRHKVCVAQGSQRALCVIRRKLEHRLSPSPRPAVCLSCPTPSSEPVCGSDTHSYASQCKLQQQACLTGKALSVVCEGLCPCRTPTPATHTHTTHVGCAGQDLSDLGERLRDWFQLLQRGDRQRNSSRPPHTAPRPPHTAYRHSPASALDRSVGSSCEASIGWMFTKLDTNLDLLLDQGELAAVRLDKYEVCIRPFFNSCDSYRDGTVSPAEWCLCFWREKPPCLAELERILIQEGGKKKLLGLFVPRCGEGGSYRRQQCSRGQCWCVDPQQGWEIPNTRTPGTPHCDDAVASSGDFGSGVGGEDEEDEEDKEAEEERAEEAEEEEGGEMGGEVDDGGYIW